ncbi:MAG TPA: ABC transporter permease [Actinomycetota bacterium]|nr:ABC transporter permease [Actinomycetota bacterium]
MIKQINAVLAIAQRDFMELLRDPARLVSSLIFPLIFIVVLGGSLQASFGDADFNLLTFTFTGVLAQTLFQSSAQGVISVIADREKDFSQEIFVTPISRYSIILGKALGETLVALPQGLALVLLGFILGVGMTLTRAIALFPVALVACMLGAAFGVLVLSNLKSQRSANQVFPFVLLPQFFLAGVFNPINDLPPALAFFSTLAPMRYAVDLMRATYYSGREEYSRVVLANPATNLLIVGVMFLVFLVVGTALFVRKERNR